MTSGTSFNPNPESSISPYLVGDSLCEPQEDLHISLHYIIFAKILIIEL